MEFIAPHVYIKNEEKEKRGIKKGTSNPGGKLKVR